jgi:hypothetical protein
MSTTETIAKMRIGGIFDGTTGNTGKRTHKEMVLKRYSNYYRSLLLVLVGTVKFPRVDICPRSCRSALLPRTLDLGLGQGCIVMFSSDVLPQDVRTRVLWFCRAQITRSQQVGVIALSFVP